MKERKKWVLNKGRIKGRWNNGKQEEKELNITIDNGRARSVKQMAKLIQTLNMHTEKSKFAGTINWCVWYIQTAEAFFVVVWDTSTLLMGKGQDKYTEESLFYSNFLYYKWSPLQISSSPLRCQFFGATVSIHGQIWYTQFLSSISSLGGPTEMQHILGHSDVLGLSVLSCDDLRWLITFHIDKN